MKNTAKYTSLFCALMLLGVVSTPAYSAISFGAAKKAQPKMIQTVKYLDGSNPALRRALNIHNLLNEMKNLKEVFQTGKDFTDEKTSFSEYLEAISDCNSKKLDGVFKDPKKAWSKMSEAYEQRRLSYGKKDDDLVKDSEQRIQDSKNTMNINRSIMLDVYENPEKWGEVEKDASFALWNDQAVIFEQEWDDFYNNMNKDFGVSLDGRPNVDKKTRQNPKKYGEVLKAHNQYLASLQQKNNKRYDAKPPKAPNPLPAWEDVVFIDPNTNEIYPKLPEVWKDPEKRKLLSKNSGSELLNVFSGGDIEKPTEQALMQKKGSLEKEFDMRMAYDAMEKGSLSYQNTMDDVKKRFNEKVAALGIDLSDMDISGPKGYLEIRKILRQEKKKAMVEAEKYIRLLEKQDMEHPELVEKRYQAQQRKMARLSSEAQQAVSQSDGIIQISQMSPVLQQKLVVVALEKDEEATVHLTETNAMDLDQLMRERQATDKLIKESQKQVKSAYTKQKEILPRLKEECLF